MGDFSIETTAEQIVDPRTRTYFREVYSSYANGNYRSAVVMLWSVVVCDLLFKLEDLKSKLDPAANAILKEIEAKQATNQTSPDWELLLIDRVKEKTHLIDLVEYTNLLMIQKHRHLSAHPVLTGTYELFSPPREMVRAHIRNALEAVLIKAALMSKKVFDVFTEDLERLQTAMPYSATDEADEELRRYLEATYLARLSPLVAESLFRSLWRLTFKSEDPRCATNRQINYRALRILYDKYETLFEARIRSEPAYFSDVAVGGLAIVSLVAFLVQRPRIYAMLSDAAKVPIKKIIEADQEQQALAWFVAGDLESHLKMVLEKVRSRTLSVSRNAFASLCSLADNHSMGELATDVAIEVYANSFNFDEAGVHFRSYLLPRIPKLTADQFERLFVGIEAHDQTYRRAASRTEHKFLKEAADKVLGAKFDYSRYPHFLKSAT
jgi:hypothetical protein